MTFPAARQPRIAIVDYGAGNTRSVYNAVRTLGYAKITVTADEDALATADAVILPGVGAFETCITNLRAKRLDEILFDATDGRRVPLLGICVGMQLLATTGEENGLHDGLGWIPGRVVRMASNADLRVPHVGWNTVVADPDQALFSRTPQDASFYFDHSYEYICDHADDEIAHCDYGKPVVAAVARDNVFGVQFHPEKSQKSGLKLLRGFFNMVSEC